MTHVVQLCVCGWLAFLAMSWIGLLAQLFGARRQLLRWDWTLHKPGVYRCSGPARSVFWTRGGWKITGRADVGYPSLRRAQVAAEQKAWR